MSKKSKKTAPASTILAIKQPTPPTTDQPVGNDAPPLPPRPEKTSSEVTPEPHVTEAKPKFPPLVTLPSTTNVTGEVFHVGDQILVKAPWGDTVIAEIMVIYQGSERTWVEYKPIEQVLEGWSWERGMVMAMRLAKK